MENGNTAPSAKKSNGKIVKTVLLAVALYFGWTFILSLPTTVQAVVLTVIAIAYLSPKVTSSRKQERSVEGNSVSRIGRAAKVLSTMSDEEFDSKFPGNTAKQGDAQQYAVYIPNGLCAPILTKERALALATSWWEEGTDDGTTGMERLNEVLSEIAYENPTIHTCVLNEHEILRLPQEHAVLEALVGIMKENGLEADLNADEQLTVFWNQYEDGKEAAQAHAEA